MKVKLNASTSEPVHVPGIGSMIPGEWMELSEKQIARFESIQGIPLKKASFLEIKIDKEEKGDK
jgi:hypothetical protein